MPWHSHSLTFRNQKLLLPTWLLLIEKGKGIGMVNYGTKEVVGQHYLDHPV